VKNKTGQALISILILASIALTVGVTAVSLVFTQSQLSFNTRESALAFHFTDGILEDVFLKILRNPSREGEETLNVQNNTCKIYIQGQNPKTVQVSCQKNNKIKKIQAQINFTNGRMLVTNIKEIP
jgi:Tfp pilus assembly protein PilX